MNYRRVRRKCASSIQIRVHVYPFRPRSKAYGARLSSTLEGATGKHQLEIITHNLYSKYQIPPRCAFYPVVCVALKKNYRPKKQKKTRELMRQEDELEDERRLAVRIVAAARTTAPRLATMSSISEQRNRWVAYKVLFHKNEYISTALELRI